MPTVAQDANVGCSLKLSGTIHLRANGAMVDRSDYKACPPKLADSERRRNPRQPKISLVEILMIKFPGGHRGRVTPVPIPNTEVKPATADGTACAGVWESRSLPGLFIS